MIAFTANALDPTFKQWSKVNGVIMNNLTPELKKARAIDGYEGLFDLVPKYFDIASMYRNKDGRVVYEFTEEQWIWFKLKWL